jgi:hypothetical protein
VLKREWLIWRFTFRSLAYVNNILKVELLPRFLAAAVRISGARMISCWHGGRSRRRSLSGDVALIQLLAAAMSTLFVILRTCPLSLRAQVGLVS